MKMNARTAQRIDPKLRMILDGDEEVNTLRAEVSGAVQAAPVLTERFPQMRRSFAVPGRPSEAPEPPKLETLSDDVTVSVFIELDDETDPTDLPHPTAQRGKLMTAELTQSQIETVSGYEGVAYVTTGDALSAPTPALSPKHVAQPVSRMVDSELAADGGRGVLIGLIDVGGFDFAHPDFLDPQGNTRFLSIWDQGGEGTPPGGFGYGAELTQKRMNEALDWSRKHHVGATDLLPQSIQVPDAHATHVASIAAGNLGVCPRATIAGVLVALSPDDRDRRRSLYDSTRLAHAVDYLFQLGAKEGMPVVVNISLGTNGHAHDGSSPICRWIDAALTVPGRCVCVAAGNAGQEAPQFAGDIGHLMGRIHTSGQIAASGLETDIEWQVVGNGIADGSENEMEIWYEPQDRLCSCEVTIRRLVRSSGAWAVHREPAAQERDFPKHLQRALSPRERGQPDRRFPHTAAQGAIYRGRSRDMDGSAPWRLCPRWSFRCLDRARRPTAAGPHRREGRLAFPLLLHTDVERGPLIRQFARMRSSDCCGGQLRRAS